MSQSNSDFARGVNWGKFIVTMHDDDGRSELARAAALSAAVDYLEDHPDDDLDAISDAWFNYFCHGTLSKGEVFAKCGAFKPEDTDD
jgi:hypothetical protein